MKRHLFPIVPFAFYAYTCGPTIGSSDTALLVEEMRTRNLSTHVNHHNLTILVGWLFSFLPDPNFAHVANLVSVFLGALAVSAFYWLVFEAYGRRREAAAAATLLMVSHSMWWHSTIAEVYAANALLTVIALILLQRLSRGFAARELGLLFFVSGLALFNHAQMGVLALGAAACLAAHVGARGPVRDKARIVLRCAAWFAAGALPYALLFVKDARREHSVARALDQALGGDFKTVMLKGDFFPSVLDALFLVVLQFPSPFLFAVAAGIVFLAREWKDRPALLGLAVILSVNTVFFAFYNTWDKFAFLLPTFIILAYCGSLALHRLWAVLDERGSGFLHALAGLAFVASVVAPIAIYARLSHWGRTGPAFLQQKFGNALTANTHDVAEYVANPNKRGYREYETFIGRLFESLPPGAIFLDDDSRTYYPIKYYQKYYNRRRDLRVEMVNVWGFEGWGLGRQGFAAILSEAYEGNKPLFLVSIAYPFDAFIVDLRDDRYRFRKFPVGDGRWVYQLLTAQAAGLPPEPPAVTRVAVGEGFDTATHHVRTAFAPQEPVMAAAYFELNSEPFPLRFRWTAPDGSSAVGSSTLVPFGCTSAWAILDRPPPLPAGRWTVEALLGDRKAGAAAFDVR